MVRPRWSLRSLIVLVVLISIPMAVWFRREAAQRRRDELGVAMAHRLRAVPLEVWIETAQLRDLDLSAWLHDLLDRCAPGDWRGWAAAHPHPWQPIHDFVADPNNKRAITKDPESTLRPRLEQLFLEMQQDPRFFRPQSPMQSLRLTHGLESIHLPVASPDALAEAAAEAPGVRLYVERVTPPVRMTRYPIDARLDLDPVVVDTVINDVGFRHTTIDGMPFSYYVCETTTPSGDKYEFGVFLPE